MLVGDIVYNDDVEVKAVYEIYRDGKFLGSNKNAKEKPLDSVLDLSVECLEVYHNTLIIMAK